MRYTLKPFIAGLLVAALVLSGVIVLANSSKENIEEKPMSLVPFFGFSVETEEATYTSLSYVGLLPLEEKVEVQTDVDLTDTVKKFGCPPIIPMKSDWIKQYSEQYNIVKVDPGKLTFFAGINGHLIMKEIIGLKLDNNLPQGWELYTSDRVGDIASKLELEFLEWRRIKEDLQEIAREIIERRMKELEEEAKAKAEEIEVPYPVIYEIIYERMLQDAVTIRRELYPLIPSEPKKPKKPTSPVPFRFEIFTIAADPIGKLEQYNVGILTLSENWLYLMEEIK